MVVTEPGVSRTEDRKYFLGFKISEHTVLESMRVLFEKIKKRLWLDEKLFTTVHRTKFNRHFKHINLWSASIKNSDVGRLGETFASFTKDKATLLEDVRVKFTKLKCEVRGARIYVVLELDDESQKILQQLQKIVIDRFQAFQNPKSSKPYGLHCSLLYVVTEISLETVKSVVNEFSEDVEGCEALLEPMIISHRGEIFFEHSTYKDVSATIHEAADGSPEWVSRSLCLMHFSQSDDIKCIEIIRSLARLSSYNDFEDYMIESCDWETEYYERSRIVAKFVSTRLRDDFYRYFLRYLASINWEFFVANVIPSCDAGIKAGVYKAVSREKDKLHFDAENTCCRLRAKYRSKIDVVTLELYLQQQIEPYNRYYFDTKGELDEILSELSAGNNTDYLSSVC